MKEKYYQIISVVLIFIFINIIFIMILLNLNENIYFKDNDWCDYDSCSQEIYKWNYNGSACFYPNNSECQDFLRLWNACQDYKNRLVD